MRGPTPPRHGVRSIRPRGAGHRAWGRAPRARGLPRSTLAALLTLAFGVVVAVVPWPSTWVEGIFARGLFPVTTHLLAPWVGAVPWSVTAALAGLWLALALVAMLTKRGRRRLLLVLLPWTAAALVLGFSLVWGLAYRRETLAAILGIPESPPTQTQLEAAQGVLLAAVRGTATSPAPTSGDVAAAARCVAAEVYRLTGARVDVPRRVARLPPGTLLRLGFAGVTSPWLLEPHVDSGLPPVARLATATHELTHSAGFAREADTDALSVLAGLRCTDPAVRYAVGVHALELLWAALPRSGEQQLLTAMPTRVVDDMRAVGEASARYRVPWMQHAATAVYGRYLQSRGVSAGMADYGRAITLIVQALARGIG